MPTLGVLMTFILSNRIGAARPCIPPFTVQVFTVIRLLGYKVLRFVRRALDLAKTLKLYDQMTV